MRKLSDSIFLCFVLFIISCNQQKFLYSVQTGTLVEQSDSGTLLTANVFTDNLEGITSMGFLYSLSEDFSNTVKVPVTERFIEGMNSVFFNTTFDIGTKVYLKAFIIAEGRVIFGEAIVFDGIHIPVVSLTNIVPQNCTWGDSITIKGSNFKNKVFPLHSLLFGSKVVSFKIVSDSVLRAKIPDDLVNANCIVSLITLSDTLISPVNLKLLPPEITEFSPIKGERGTEIIISGKYFHPDKNRDLIKLGNYDLQIQSCDGSHIHASVPEIIIPEGNYKLTVKCGDQSTIASGTYTHSELWTIFNQGQVYVDRYYPTTEIIFQGNGQIYKAVFNQFERRLGKYQHFLSLFDNQTASFKSVWSYIQYYISIEGVFISDNGVFYLCTNKEVGGIDLSGGLAPKRNFPGNLLPDSFCFSLSNKGYVFAGPGELWHYNTIDDSWTQKINIPSGTCVKYMEIRNLAYFLFKLSDDSYDFYSYDPPKDQWKFIKHYMPDEIQRIGGSWLGYGDKGYCLNREYRPNNVIISSLYHFDPITSSWVKRAGVPDPSSGSLTLLYGFENFLYAMNKTWLSGDAYTFKTWKYDLTRGNK